LRSLATTAQALKRVLPYIGELQLEDVHDDTLAPFKDAARRKRLSAGTVNRSLGVVRRILNLAARKWRDGSRTWLAAPPLIDMVKGKARRPYPMSWDEQARLFAELPDHLRQMALFKVNTGCREQEVCQLRWEWEVAVPELGTSVFVLPEWLTKNGEERVVVLNAIAKGVVTAQRGTHATHVFAFRGHPVKRITNTAWRKARVRADIRQVRVHDLKHTFGYRLRAAGVRLEDRKPLLGHTTGEITTHYSAPDLARLIQCAELACERRRTTILRVVGQN
jgi:integrase